MSWCTPEQANNITNKDNFTQSELDFAYQIVELFVNVTTDAQATIKPRDLRNLRKAEAFHALWLRSQVDYTSRTDVDQITQDGVSFSKADPDAHTLAPLAKLAIQRLSWRQSRAMSPLTPQQALYLRGVRDPNLSYTGLEEWLDDRDHWESLP